MTLLLLCWCWCFTAIRHFSDNCGSGQLTYSHCSRSSLLGSLPVLSAHSFASNWQLPFLNQRKGENGRRNYFKINLHERMLPDVRIEPATVRITGRRASERAAAPGWRWIWRRIWSYSNSLLKAKHNTRFLHSHAVKRNYCDLRIKERRVFRPLLFSIAIELNVPRGWFNSIVIELNLVRRGYGWKNSIIFVPQNRDKGRICFKPRLYQMIILFAWQKVSSIAIEVL